MVHQRNFQNLTRLIVSVSLATSIFFIALTHCIEDDLQFLMKWPGALPDLDIQKLETLDIMTSGHEKYKCTLPVNLADSEKEEENNRVILK